MEKINQNQNFYNFEDGVYSFWQGEVEGKIVVIRVRNDTSPGIRWIDKGLPKGITIHEADPDLVEKWLQSHPQYRLIK